MAQPLSYGCTWQLVSTHEATITLSYCLMGGCKAQEKHKRSARVTLRKLNSCTIYHLFYNSYSKHCMLTAHTNGQIF